MFQQIVSIYFFYLDTIGHQFTYTYRLIFNRSPIKGVVVIVDRWFYWHFGKFTADVAAISGNMWLAVSLTTAENVPLVMNIFAHFSRRKKWTGDNGTIGAWDKMIHWRNWSQKLWHSHFIFKIFQDVELLV